MTAPVQDDDAEWLRSFQVRSQRMLQDGDLERFEAIADRLTPSADHSLVETLREVREALTSKVFMGERVAEAQAIIDAALGKQS